MPWKEADVTGLAEDMIASLPAGTVEWLKGWKGGPLIKLPNELARPVAKNLEENRLFVLPVLRRFAKTAF